MFNVNKFRSNSVCTSYCHVCDGILTPCVGDFSANMPDFGPVIVHDIPALYCADCGEIVYDSDTAKRIEKDVAAQIDSIVTAQKFREVPV